MLMSFCFFNTGAFCTHKHCQNEQPLSTMHYIVFCPVHMTISFLIFKFETALRTLTGVHK